VRLESVDGPWSGQSLLRSGAGRRARPAVERMQVDRIRRELAPVGAGASRNGDGAGPKSSDGATKRLSLDAGELEKF